MVFYDVRLGFLWRSFWFFFVFFDVSFGFLCRSFWIHFLPLPSQLFWLRYPPSGRNTEFSFQGRASTTWDHGWPSRGEGWWPRTCKFFDHDPEWPQHQPQPWEHTPGHEEGSQTTRQWGKIQNDLILFLFVSYAIKNQNEHQKRRKRTLSGSTTSKETIRNGIKNEKKLQKQPKKTKRNGKRNEKKRRRTPWETKRNQEERHKKPRATAWGTKTNRIKNENERQKKRRGTIRNQKKHSVNCA